MNQKVLYRVALFCLFSMLSAVLMHAGEQQQKSKGIVTGRIVDQQKQPYYPVAVAIEGVYIGGYTNENGVYHINDVPARYQMIFYRSLRNAVKIRTRIYNRFQRW